MKLRRWGTVPVALGLIAALTMISPALGGPSLQSLVKKEVTKQLNAAQTAKKKKSKRGPPGPAGPAGANGAAGSALGFATVSGSGTLSTAESSPGITQSMVTKENGGTAFCFNGLPFTPRMVLGNVDDNFAVNFYVQTTGPGDAGGCAGNEQASAVEVNAANGAVVTSPVTIHLAFY
jgi:hypothetical protein